MEVKKRNLRLYGQILTYWQFNGGGAGGEEKKKIIWVKDNINTYLTKSNQK